MPKGQSAKKCVRVMKKKGMRRSEAHDACSAISAKEKKDGKKYKATKKTVVKTKRKTYK